ncbi:MAG: ATP-binding protein [Pseudomonadota bacterium]
MTRTATLLIIAYLIVSAGVGWGAWRLTLHANLTALEGAATTRVKQAADRLTGQLSAYRVMVNMLADHPEIEGALVRSSPPELASELLRDSILTFGAAEAVLLSRSGETVASAGARPHRDDAALLRAALNGRMGVSTTLDGDLRQFRFSRGVQSADSAPFGAILISVDVADLEFEWTVDPEPVVLLDADGRALSANRQGLIGARIGDNVLRFGPEQIGETTAFSGAPLPEEALIVASIAPQIGLTAYGFSDTAPARAAAAQALRLALAIMGALGLLTAFAWLWRRRLSDRLAIEEAANARLEARVEERTDELRAAQSQLVQASKLTALGQMSAGITHELNQPLAAIRNFAENGALLLDRDRRDDVRANLTQIAGQVERIDRIIRNLRGFARGEEEPVSPVDLCAAAREALALAETQLAKAGIAPKVEFPSEPVVILGGAVRLQQVILNLISNALDAMSGIDDPRLSLTLTAAEGQAALSVSDTGPGVSNPERIFEPFYTTKELGASKGLGLGLAISYGIIGGFGGEITCSTSDKGANFTITLPLAEVK